MSRPFPRICATCRERSVQPITLPSYSTTVEHDGRSYIITLADVSGTQCDNCCALILDDSVSDRIDDQLREQAGLLRPAEIRSYRQTLGLTQKALAQKLQIGEATLSRWETGAQIQQRSLDLLLRLCFDLISVRQYLGIGLSEQVVHSKFSHSLVSVAQQLTATTPVSMHVSPVNWNAQTQSLWKGARSGRVSGTDPSPKPTGPKLRMAS